MLRQLVKDSLVHLVEDVGGSAGGCPPPPPSLLAHFCSVALSVAKTGRAASPGDALYP